MASGRSPHAHIKPLEQALAARFGWQTGASWRDNLLAAIDRKANKVGLDEMAYIRMAVRSQAELDALAELVSNSETRFFREPEQFESLRTQVLPRLIESRAKEKRLDLWSAACSTGEEAYSLAILLREALPESAGWKTGLMATDLRSSAIISASRGSYLLSSIRLIDPALRHAYFVKGEISGRERAYDVIPAVRRMITFRRGNLYDANFWKQMTRQFDLILCNNVLLYFHALAARQTVDRLAGALKPGGLLMVMKNEAGYVYHPRLRLETSLAGSFFVKI